MMSPFQQLLACFLDSVWVQKDLVQFFGLGENIIVERKTAVKTADPDWILVNPKISQRLFEFFKNFWAVFCGTKDVYGLWWNCKMCDDPVNQTKRGQEFFPIFWISLSRSDERRVDHQETLSASLMLTAQFHSEILNRTRSDTSYLSCCPVIHTEIYGGVVSNKKLFMLFVDQASLVVKWASELSYEALHHQISKCSIASRAKTIKQKCTLFPGCLTFVFVKRNFAEAKHGTKPSVIFLQLLDAMAVQSVLIILPELAKSAVIALTWRKLFSLKLIHCFNVPLTLHTNELSFLRLWVVTVTGGILACQDEDLYWGIILVTSRVLDREGPKLKLKVWFRGMRVLSLTFCPKIPGKGQNNPNKTAPPVCCWKWFNVLYLGETWAPRWSAKRNCIWGILVLN